MGIDVLWTIGRWLEPLKQHCIRQGRFRGGYYLDAGKKTHATWRGRWVLLRFEYIEVSQAW